LHIGGAGAVLDEFKPRRVIDNGAPDRSSVHQDLIVRLARREIARRGDLIRLSRNVTARVLYPAAGFKAKGADDQTLVVQLIVDEKFRVLLVFDSGLSTEKALLELAAPNDLQSDILIKGQHYSGESGSLEFLNAVRPRLIVATSRDFPARERIPDAWARLVQDRGITLYRQDETGAVDLQFFRNEWRATPFLTHAVFRSASR
jgi:beta-lactamase superfamily II metal-dependent hydrolase